MLVASSETPTRHGSFTTIGIHVYFYFNYKAFCIVEVLLYILIILGARRPHNILK